MRAIMAGIPGSGSSPQSVGSNAEIPIDVLKIDRSFVSGMVDPSESAAIVHTLVQRGQALGLQTVAEGIETDDQRELLTVEEVDLGQGFLFGRPMPIGALDDLPASPSSSPAVSTGP